MDDFYSFSFETNTWEEVEVSSVAKPGCRENNSVVIGDSSRVYLFGGYNGKTWLNDLWTFDIGAKCWTCLQESSDSIPIENENSMVRSSRSSTTGGNTFPSRRFGYVSVVHNNKFILWGGFDGSRWLNDMYEFDYETTQWREVDATGQLPSARSCPAWSKDDTQVYIQGGYDGVERKSDFYTCDLSTYTWIEIPSKGTPPSPRYFHSCCLFDNKMYTYGGYSGSERLSDMYCYDFDTEFWSEIDCSLGSCPSGRSSLVAQVYGNNLYVFGGYNGETVLNDFYKFRLKAVSIPPSNYLNDMRGLVNNPDLSDVTFLVDGREIFANKAILAARSDYFHTMLYSSHMRESVQTKSDASNSVITCERQPIEIKDVTYSVFIKMLEFIYMDSLSETTLETGILLLIASDKFMLNRLKGMCEDTVRRHITIYNVSEILLTSHQHNATGLKEIALEFLLTNLNIPTVIKGLTVSLYISSYSMIYLSSEPFKYRYSCNK